MKNEEFAAAVQNEERRMKNEESAAAVTTEQAISSFGMAAANSSFFILNSSFKKDSSFNFDLDSALATISPQRRDQAMRLRRDDDRRRCVAAYLLLKEALLREYGIADNPEFGYHDGGKPFLIGRPDVHFSISHCRTAVAVAVGKHPLGIDIETIRPYKPAVARHVLNDAELRMVEASDRPDVEFIRLWTMKESYLKMTGEGIRSDLRQVSLDAARFYTETDMARGYICTICHPVTESISPMESTTPTSHIK